MVDDRSHLFLKCLEHKSKLLCRLGRVYTRRGRFWPLDGVDLEHAGGILVRISLLNNIKGLSPSVRVSAGGKVVPVIGNGGIEGDKVQLSDVVEMDGAARLWLPLGRLAQQASDDEGISASYNLRGICDGIIATNDE